MQNSKALKELNDVGTRTVLVKKLLDNKEGKLLLTWMEMFYSQGSVNFENSNLTYFNLGKLDVIKQFTTLINKELKEKK